MILPSGKKIHLPEASSGHFMPPICDFSVESSEECVAVCDQQPENSPSDKTKAKTPPLVQDSDDDDDDDLPELVASSSDEELVQRSSIEVDNSDSGTEDGSSSAESGSPKISTPELTVFMTEK